MLCRVETKDSHHCHSVRTDRGNSCSSKRSEYSTGASILQAEHMRSIGSGLPRLAKRLTYDHLRWCIVKPMRHYTPGTSRLVHDLSKASCPYHCSVSSKSGALTVESTNNVDVELNFWELAMFIVSAVNTSCRHTISSLTKVLPSTCEPL
jgi:hypothetical protein